MTRRDEHVWVVSRGKCGHDPYDIPVLFRTTKGVRAYVAQETTSDYTFAQHDNDRRFKSWWTFPANEPTYKGDEYIHADWERVYP